jgi:farnesyl diphosphate synthase
MTIDPNLTPEDFVQQTIEHFNKYEHQYLQSLSFPDELLLEAVLYVMQTPGKKFRALMIYATGLLFDLPYSILDRLALSIEMIHAYSLVHDDLPAMDNDDYRRGRPSCHKAFDEATAILTGNTLNHLAFSLLIDELPNALSIPVMQLILKCIGPQGILSGQSMDLKILQQKNLNLEQLKEIHHLKTTALLEAVVIAVAICGHAPVNVQKALEEFANHLGLAYQMLDDYGDFYATEIWGKKQSSDSLNEKFTFVNFYEKDELQKLIESEFSKAKESIIFLEQSKYLIYLVEQMESRLHQIPRHP